MRIMIMKYNSVRLLSLIMIISACQTTQTKDQSQALSQGIIGEWKNVSMKVTFPNDSVFDVPGGQWEDILQIRPIVTTYADDKSYTSRYYSLSDSLVFTSQGNWHVSKDSLYLISDSDTTAYKFTKEGVKGFFTGYVDWDGNGQKDDLYFGVQTKSAR